MNIQFYKHGCQYLRTLTSIQCRKWANLFLEQSCSVKNLSIDEKSNLPFERIDKGQYLLPHNPRSSHPVKKLIPLKSLAFSSSRVLGRITYHLHHPITAFILLPSLLCFPLSAERKPVIYDVWCSSKVTMERIHTYTHTHTHKPSVSKDENEHGCYSQNLF